MYIVLIKPKKQFLKKKKLMKGTLLFDTQDKIPSIV